MISTFKSLSGITCFVFFLTGCGSSSDIPTGEVRGKVTFQGTPLTEGVVSFYSSELGSGASAPIMENGNYAIQEPLRTGRYAVTVLPPPEPPPQEEVPVSTKKEYKNIPLKYRVPQKSGLTFNIEKGENSFDIEMIQ